MGKNDFLKKMELDMEEFKRKAELMKLDMVNQFSAAISKIETYEIKTGGVK